MSKKKSSRCGFGKCQFYDKHNKLSACTIYTDRNECTKSVKHKKEVSKFDRLGRRGIIDL